MDQFEKALTELREALITGDAEAYVSAKEYTTFKAGGDFRLFVSPGTDEELKKTLVILKENGIPVFLLGRGSNVLVSDEGFPGAVISLRKFYSEVSVSGSEITCGAGIMMPELAKTALLHGLTGLEFISGIPGTLGGGIRMNAGAYGGELSGVIRQVKVLFPDLTLRTVENKDMDFSYRHSMIEDTPGAVVLSAVIGLTPGDPERIRETMAELMKKRKDKQPLEYPSAGSTFKRPAGHYAGALIEEAGLKGYRVGDAEVSVKHAGFVINRGSAKASDIYRLTEDVIRIVKEKSGVTLEREVILLGSF